MNPFFKIHIFVFILTIYFLSTGQERKITVSGTLVDSETGEPLPDVLILITDNVSDIMSGNVSALVNSIVNNNQALKSDNSGNFSAEITVNQNALLLTGIFVKEDYQYKVQPATVLIDRADFSTITLHKEEFRDVEISGIIKDSTTDQPVSGATVYITNTSIIIDSVFYALTTDDQGKFSHKMKIGKGGIIPPLISSALIVYTVQKAGYDSFQNMVPDNGNSNIDLGTIYIINRNTHSKHVSMRTSDVSKPRSSYLFIYALNGRLLYSGPELKGIFLKTRDLISPGPVVVRYEYPQTHSKERLFNLSK